MITIYISQCMLSIIQHTQGIPQSQVTCILTENAQKGSLVDCQEDVSYTALTIVCTINVSIDCDCFDVSNPSTRKNIHKRKSSQ